MKCITRKIISIGLSIVLLGGLTGCTQKDKTAAETVSTAVEFPKELVLWYTNEELTNYINASVNAYQEEYHVKVTPKLVSAIDYIENMNQATLSEDVAPDLFIADSSSLEKIYLAGLSTENTDETLTEDNYYKTALHAFTYKDKVLAYPLYFETSYLLYNQDYVKDAPKTIDDMINFANEFDAPEGVESIFNWDVTDILSNYFFIGNYLNNDEVNTQNYIVDKIKLTEAFQYYQNLNQYFAIDAQTVDYNTAFQNFVEGKSVFTIAKTDKLSEIEKIEGDVSDKLQTNKNANIDENNEANEERTDEAKEKETSTKKDEKSTGESSQETSKDNQADNESLTQEPIQGSKSISSLNEDLYAGVEKIWKQAEQMDEEEVTQEQKAVEETKVVAVPEETIESENQISSNQDSKFKIAILPDLTEQLKARGIALNYGVFVNGYTKQQEQAKVFAKYLTYDRVKALYKEAGKLASRTNLDYKNENINQVLKQYESSQSSPKVMENADYWLKLEIAFSNIWKGDDVAEAIDIMQ